MLPFCALVVLGCWIIPFAVHNIPRRVYAAIKSVRKIGVVLAPVLVLVCLALIILGSVQLFQFHTRHLARVLSKETTEPMPLPPPAVDKPEFVPSFPIPPHIGASSESYKPYPIPQDAAVVTLIVKIENKGAPSITKNWTFELTTADGVVHKTVVTVIPSFKTMTLYRDKEDQVAGAAPPILHRDDEIEDKTAAKPIEHNAAPVGFIMYVVPDVKYKTPRQKGTKFRLTFEDINGKQYDCSYVSTGIRGDQPERVPGLDLNSKPRPRKTEQEIATKEALDHLSASLNVGPEDELNQSLLSVVNNSSQDIDKHMIYCGIKSIAYPNQIVFADSSGLGSMSSATPRGRLVSGGDGETVKCLKALPSHIACADIFLTIDFSLVKWPQQRVTKRFRFVSAHSKSGTSWAVEPLEENSDYCVGR